MNAINIKAFRKKISDVQFLDWGVKLEVKDLSVNLKYFRGLVEMKATEIYLDKMVDKILYLLVGQILYSFSYEKQKQLLVDFKIVHHLYIELLQTLLIKNGIMDCDNYTAFMEDVVIGKVTFKNTREVLRDLNIFILLDNDMSRQKLVNDIIKYT